jgi:polyvinyl alcohol dehydrogenase (cytochrome)
MVVTTMSFEDEQKERVSSAGFRSAIGLAISLVTLSPTIPVYANVDAPNSAAYQEVTVPLDPETKAVGGALYAQHCAACHDGNMVRAPQRYVLENVSPSTLLAAMIDGPMREVAADLSLEQKTAVAEYIAERKVSGVNTADAGVACEGAPNHFDLSQTPVFQHWGLDANASHFMPPALAHITQHNINSLELDWAFAYPDATRARSQPAFGGGAIFVGSQSGLVYSFDMRTGCTRWQFQASSEVRNGLTLERWDATAKPIDPLLFFGDLTGNQYAVSALTGELRWKKRIDDHSAATLTAAAELSDGVLYVPVSSLEEGAAIAAGYPCCSFRGAIVALDAKSGDEIWRRHFIPAAEQSGVNAAGTAQYGPSGVPIWAGMAMDADYLYIATGDDYSGDGSETSDAIIALDKASGRTVWVRQARFGDIWNGSCENVDPVNCPEDNGPDYDYGAGPVISEDSKGRRIILAGDKGGVVTAMLAETGESLWKTKVGRGGVVAGVNFGLAAYDGKVFVPISDVPDGRQYDEPARPGVYALDVDNGEYVWQAPAGEDVCLGRPGCYPGYSASISVTADYVLAGSNEGWLRAFDVDNGEVLWEFDTTQAFTAVDGRMAQGGSIGGGQAPLVVGDRLILNSGYAFAGKMPGNALLVFKLPVSEAHATQGSSTHGVLESAAK